VKKGEKKSAQALEEINVVLYVPNAVARLVWGEKRGLQRKIPDERG